MRHVDIWEPGNECQQSTNCWGQSLTHHEFALKFSVSKHRVDISFSSFMGKICFALAAASLLLNNSRMDFFFFRVTAVMKTLSDPSKVQRITFWWWQKKEKKPAALRLYLVFLLHVSLHFENSFDLICHVFMIHSLFPDLNSNETLCI